MRVLVRLRYYAAHARSLQESYAGAGPGRTPREHDQRSVDRPGLSADPAPRRQTGDWRASVLGVAADAVLDGAGAVDLHRARPDPGRRTTGGRAQRGSRASGRRRHLLGPRDRVVPDVWRHAP